MALAGNRGEIAEAGTGPFAYVANLSSGRVAVVDLGTETEVASIVTGGEPYWVAISGNGATVAASLQTRRASH
jgi:YVTN family beta-propeller protein